MIENTYIVMPAYNASKTIAATIGALPVDVTARLLVCNDASTDETAQVCRELQLELIAHPRNRGYGGNQKSLYDKALQGDARIVIMVHPDNQYDTSCLPEMIELLASGAADIVLATRMKTARKNGMPLWRYIPNRSLSWAQRTVFKRNHTEFHTGLRGYSAAVLADMPYRDFSDKFVFDSELLAWAIAHGYRIGEVDTNCYYGGDVSSIRVLPSIRYGLETLQVLWRFKRGAFHRMARRI